ncbi:MAG: hypothetical protein GY811_07755 [Myxococcales bacterium]|nr:hypothetical protein [Myxococcales bacterium]
MAAKLALRSVALVALVALLVGARAGKASGESRPVYGQTLVTSLLEEPLGVDPIAARTHTDMTVVALLFDTLYKRAGAVVVPHLALELPDVRDPLRVVIALRPGVTFHDGTPLRGQDVASSLERLRKSEMGFMLGPVKSIRAGAKVEEGQPHTVVLTLRRADPDLAKRLTDLHSSIVARGSAPSWRRLVGTGAWRFKQRSSSGRSLTLTAFDAHFAGRGYLDELVMRWHVSPDAEARLYEAGTTHISARGSIAFAGHRPKYRTLSVEEDIEALSYLGFGSASPITKEAEFRRAVSSSIGRLGMRQIGSGEAVVPTTTILVPRREPRAFALQANLSVARSLLKSLSARFPQLEAKTLSLQLIVNSTRPDDAIIAARVAAALFQHGITTRIVSLRAGVFASRSRGGECDLFIGQLATSGASPLAQLRKAFVLGKQGKTARRLAGKSRPTIERQLAMDLPIVPLFRRSLRLHIRTDVHGIALSSGNTVDYPAIHFHGEAAKN